MALTNGELRDYLLRAHQMATCSYKQTDATMRNPIGAMLEEAIGKDEIMSGFLGRGGPAADRDILGDNAGLEDKPLTKSPRPQE